MSGLDVRVAESVGTQQKEHRRVAKDDAVTLGEEQNALSAGQGPPDPCGIPQGLDFALDKMGRDGVGWG